MSSDPSYAPKVLFVCSLNRFRSYTAEKLYEGFDRYQVRSRGTENGARIKVTEADIRWADLIFTMEKCHTDRLRARFREHLAGKRLVTLFIKDLHPPMSPALIEELKDKLQGHLEVPV